MFKKLGDGLLAGLGAVVLTSEKISEVTQRLVDEAKLTKEEAAKLNQELVERGGQEWHMIEEQLCERLPGGKLRLGFGFREDMDRLAGRVEDLEKKLALLESVVARQSAAQQQAAASSAPGAKE